MKKHIRSRSLLSAFNHALPVRGFFGALAIVAMALAPAKAATLTWDATGELSADPQDGGGEWLTNSAFFANGTVFDNDTTTGPGDIAVFGAGHYLYSTPAVVNVGTQTIAGLVFGPTVDNNYIGYSLVGAYFATIPSYAIPQVLTIGSSGITMTSDALATSIGNDDLSITLGAAQSWTNNAYNLLTVAGNVSNGSNLLTLGAGYAGGITISGGIGNGAGGVTVDNSGSGVVTLSGTNTYTGATTLDAGALLLTGALSSSSALIVGGGEFTYAPAVAGSTQTVAGLTVGLNISTISGSSGSTLALGGITRIGSDRGTVDFDGTTTGAIQTSAPNTNNILGPWAAYASGTSLAYAAVNGGAIGPYAYTGAGDSSITTPASITAVNGAANYTLSGTTSATAGNSASIDTLRYTGSGLTITPGATGGLTLNGLMNAGTGALTIATNPVTIGAGSGDYANELVITGSTQAIAISSAIRNNGTNASALTYSGAGVLTLSGTNTYTGATTVNAGTLAIAGAGDLGGGSYAGNIAIATNATLNLSSSVTQIFSGTISGGGALTTSGSGTLSESSTGLIAGSISFTQGSSGTSILAAANSYTGGTTITGGGTLTLGVANALPSGTALTLGQPAGSNPSTLNTGGHAQTISSLTFFADNYESGASVVNVGAGTLTLDGDISLLDNTNRPGDEFSSGGMITASSGGTLNLGGAVRNITVAGQTSPASPGDLTIDAIIANGGIDFTGNPSSFSGVPAEMTLGASAPNTYAGGTTVNAGTLNVASTTTLGAATGALTLNSSGSVASTVVLSSAQTIGALQTGTLSASAAATVDLSGTTVSLTVNQASSTTYAGDITGSGSLSMPGAGILTLSGADTYTGGTTISGRGTLQFAKTASLPATGAVSVSSGATLAVNAGGTGEFTNATSGNGSIGGLLSRVSFASGATFGIDTTNTPGGNFTYAGAISNPNSGANTLGLTVLGTGVLTLTGSNTYTGATTVAGGTLTIDPTQGTLILGAAHALPTGTALTIGSLAATDALLDTGGFATTISSLTVYAPPLNQNLLTGFPTVINIHTGTLTITGNISFLNATGGGGAEQNLGAIISAGTGGTLNLGGAVRNITSAPQGIFGGLFIDAIIADGGINFTGIPYPGFSVIPVPGLTLGASAPNTYAGGTTVNAGELNVVSTTTLGAATGALTLNTSGSNNSFVVLNRAQTIGSLRTGTVSAGAVATVFLQGASVALTVNQEVSTTYAGGISGSGSLIMSGTGNLTLAGPSSYTGPTTINAGTLTIAGAGILGGNALSSTFAGNFGGGSYSNSITIAKNAALKYSSSATQIFSGEITGAGALTVGGGANLLILTGSNNYTGGTTVAAGTLTLGAANALPMGGALTLGSTATTTPLLNTGGFAQKISSLTMYAVPTTFIVGTNSVPTPVVNIPKGTLTVTGNISVLSSTGGLGAGANEGGVEIAAGAGGKLDLGGAVRNITVAGQGGGGPFGDLIIQAIVADGGINFTGNPSTSNSVPTGMSLGAMAPNTYAGGTTVNAGTLYVASTTTLGAPTGALTLNTSGSAASVVVLNSAQTIGSLRTGTLSSHAAATVDLNGSNVTLTVNQASSTTYAGNITGAGSFIKTGAGTLTFTGSSNLGGNVLVGHSSTLDITGGGQVNDITGAIGYGSAFANVSGVGSKWKNSASLLVGYSGTGSLQITGSGFVSDTIAAIGDQAGSRGAVTVSGVGSKWVNTGLTIGNSGAGSLTLATGGNVAVTGTTTIGAEGLFAFDGSSTFTTSSLLVEGGTLETLGALTFAHGATLAGPGMSVNTAGFTSIFSGVFSGAGGLTKTGAGALTLSGSNTYTGGTTISTGTVALTTTSSSHIASLGNTAITVDSGASFSPGVLGSGKMVNAGATGSGNAGATLTLAPGSALSLTGATLFTFNLQEGASFSKTAFTIGGASGVAPTLTFDIGNAATGADLLHVTKNADVLATGGKITIDALAGDTTLTAGSYDLITAGGGFTGTGGNKLTLTDSTLSLDGKIYDLSLANSTTTAEILTISLAPTANLARAEVDSTPSSQTDAVTPDAVSPAMDLAATPSAEDRFTPPTASRQLTTTAVPEPADLALLALPAIAAAALLRRHRE